MTIHGMSRLEGSEPAGSDPTGLHESSDWQRKSTNVNDSSDPFDRYEKFVTS